jgi:hypothetical protein
MEAKDLSGKRDIHWPFFISLFQSSGFAVMEIPGALPLAITF